MAKHGEDFSGGLVTIRDPAFLGENELAECQNAVYIGGSLSLYRCQGRSLFASAVDDYGNGVAGIDTLFFAAPNQQSILAHAGSALATAQIGATGVFGTVEDIVPGNTLTTIQARGGYVILNGAGLNAAIAQTPNTSLNRYWYWGHPASVSTSGTASDTLMTRTHGMLPVASPPVGTKYSSGSTSGLPAVSVTGYYDYWTTESLKYSELGQDYFVEGTFTGNPQTFWISSTANGPYCPTIIRPAIVNNNATHWSVYRSPQKESPGQALWPDGTRLSRLDIAATSYVDAVVTAATTARQPTKYNPPSYVRVPWDSGGRGESHHSLAHWTGASALLSGNSGSAIAPAVPRENPYNRSRFWQGFYDFGFTPFDGGIVGIELTVSAKWATTDYYGNAFYGNGTNNVELGACIGPRNPQTGDFQDLYVGGGSESHGLPIKYSGTNFTAGIVRSVVLGGPTDKWVDANFGLTSEDWAAGEGKWMVAIAAASCEITYLALKLYYGSGDSSSVIFPAVVVEQSGATTACGEDGPPPIATTGDIYKGSMVLNSVGEKRLIRWSTPDKFDSFPELYWMELPMHRGDEVKAIRTLGRTLIVGGKYSLFRVNYLPSEDDANFQRGAAIDVLDAEHGIMDPKACAFFTSPSDGRSYLAYISMDGIRSTDGFSVQLLTSQLDWDRVTAGTEDYLREFLVNHVTNHELRSYVCGSADTGINERYHLNYHPNHLGGKGLKVSGPVKIGNAWSYSSERHTSETLDILWDVNGMPATPDVDQIQGSAFSCSDGASGVLIGFAGGSQMYAQRLSPLGDPLWGASGVVLGELSASSGFVRGGIYSNASGGAFLSWCGNPSTIYVQNLSASGDLLWGLSGAAVGNGTRVASAVVAPDGSGGAYVAWEDYQDDLETNNVLVQRVYPGGLSQWATAGYAVSSASSLQTNPNLVPDGSGGIYAVWDDLREGEKSVHLQRLLPSGTALWGADGIKVLSGSADHNLACAGIADYTNEQDRYSHELIVAWSDYRYSTALPDDVGASGQIMAQRFSASGSAMWLDASGTLVGSTDVASYSAAMIGDGYGGACLAWSENGVDPVVSQLRASWLLIDGSAMWGSGGVPVAPSPVGGGASPVINDVETAPVMTLKMRARRWTDGWGNQYVNQIPTLTMQTNVPGGDPAPVNIFSWGLPGGWPVYIPDAWTEATYTLTDEQRQMVLEAPSLSMRIGQQSPWGFWPVMVSQLILEDTVAGTTRAIGPFQEVEWPLPHSSWYPVNAATTFDALSKPVPDDSSWICHGDPMTGGPENEWEPILCLMAHFLQETPVYTDQMNPSLCRIPEAGAFFVSWDNHLSGESYGMDVFGQYINGAGDLYWENGLGLAVTAGTQARTSTVTDHAGGAIISWVDGRLDEGDERIYAQRVGYSEVIISNPNSAVSFRAVADDLERHYIGYGDGSVFIDTEPGTTAPWKTGDSADRVSTRRMYLAGFGNEWKLNQTYLHGAWPQIAPTLNVWGTRTGASEALAGAAEYTAVGASSRLDRGWSRLTLEGGRFALSLGLQPWRLDSFILDGEDFGGEDSGKP